MKDYTIGITTFDKRFDLVKKLIESIREYRDNPIIVTVNGEFSETYRRDSLAYFSNIYNVFPIYFVEMRGLAKMFNSIFIHSKNEDVLVFNDDIEVTSEDFFNDVESAFDKLQDVCKLQTTWYASFSHFIAKKSVINKLGYFDERLLGFGEEDGDITFRYIKEYNREVPTYHVRGLHHSQSELRHDIKPGIGKYSLFNREFMFKEKYKLGEGTISGMFGQPAIELLDIEQQYPYESFFENNKHKLV